MFPWAGNEPTKLPKEIVYTCYRPRWEKKMKLHTYFSSLASLAGTRIYVFQYNGLGYDASCTCWMSAWVETGMSCEIWNSTVYFIFRWLSVIQFIDEMLDIINWFFQDNHKTWNLFVTISFIFPSSHCIPCPQKWWIQIIPGAGGYIPSVGIMTGGLFSTLSPTSGSRWG